MSKYITLELVTILFLIGLSFTMYLYCFNVSNYITVVSASITLVLLITTIKKANQQLK